MGLSSTPKDTITSLQVALDIAQSLKVLAGNPDLDKLAKDAYALPEAEQAKADSARKAIADNQAVLSDIKAQQLSLASAQTALDSKQASISDDLKKIDERTRNLDQREDDLKQVAVDQSQAFKDIDCRQRELEEAIALLERNKADLQIEKQKIADYETSLKAKAAQLKGLTEGM